MPDFNIDEKKIISNDKQEEKENKLKNEKPLIINKNTENKTKKFKKAKKIIEKAKEAIELVKNNTKNKSNK